MADVIQAWASLNLIGVLLWAMCVEIRTLRRNARQQ